MVFIFNGTLDNCQEIFRNATNNLILFSMQDKIYFMKDHLTVKQKKVACVIQKDIVVMRFPFNELGNLCGLTNEDVLDTTKQLFKKGFIRKYGAILRHQKAGYEKNALVVWSVPADQIEKAGKIFASFLFVSHCYERKPAFREKYNIFTMLHSKDENILSLIKNMATATDIHDYLIFESIQEYKKISPEYFR